MALTKGGKKRVLAGARASKFPLRHHASAPFAPLASQKSHCLMHKWLCTITTIGRCRGKKKSVPRRGEGEAGVL